MKTKTENVTLLPVLFVCILVGYSLYSPQLISEEKPALSLKRALQIAQRNNSTLKAMRQNVASSEALLLRSIGSLTPAAYANLEYTRLDHATKVDNADLLGDELASLLQVEGSVVLSEKSSSAANAMVKMPLIDLPSWYTVKEAKSGVKIAELSFETAKRQVLLQVARAFLVALCRQELHLISEQHVLAARDHLTSAKVRFEAGAGSKLDVLRAQVQLSEAEASSLESTQALQMAKLAIGELLGTSEHFRLDSSDGGLVESLSVSPFLERTGRNPEEALALEYVVASKSSKAASVTKLFPRVDATWTGTHRLTDNSPMESSDATRWSAMLSVTVPIFDLSIYGEIRQKRAEAMKAGYESEAKTRQLDIEYREANILLKRLEEELTLKMKNLERTVEIHSLAKHSYETGEATALEVSDALADMTASRLELKVIALQRNMSLLTIAHLQGRTIGSNQ